jgi:hypothetical protein
VPVKMSIEACKRPEINSLVTHFVTSVVDVGNCSNRPSWLICVIIDIQVSASVRLHFLRDAQF